jgi:hypothetical protein
MTNSGRDGSNTKALVVVCDNNYINFESLIAKCIGASEQNVNHRCSFDVDASVNTWSTTAHVIPSIDMSTCHLTLVLVDKQASNFYLGVGILLK